MGSLRLERTVLLNEPPSCPTNRGHFIPFFAHFIFRRSGFLGRTFLRLQV